MNYSKRLLAFGLMLLMGVTTWAAPGKKEVKYLSGTDNIHTKTWDFFCTSGRKSGEWTTIEVPSQWEQQGFGEYDYGRDYRTDGKKFRFSDETGIYKHKFSVPADWKGKRIYIVFEGSMTDTEVKINGQSAGPIHQGAFYRFRYDITDKLKVGTENELEATVHKMSANHSVNRAERYADYWIFGGIFRPVYLEAYPEEHIDRVAINAKADGSFYMDAFPMGLTKKKTIKAEIIDADGNVVQKCDAKANPEDSLVSLTCQVENPKQWTSETPNLYSVKVSLDDGSTPIYQLTQKFGFRTIEIRKGDGIYINGTKVKFRGINRHVFWPETGRCINPTIDLNDVNLMKNMNLNAVRCSHYPPNQSFLNICDSLGLFVLDELAGWQNYYDTEVGSKLVREMVIRDVNHPSIIFWDNGNEGGTNPNLDDDFAIYDPSNRPVIHPHHKPGHAFNGIDCNHYENYYSSKHILSEGKIYMPTEFLHSQDDGGGGASLGDFWELFWDTPNSGGGFTWALLDEGVVRTDLNGFIDVNRVNAPDGVVGPHREKEGSYYAMRQIYCPVHITMKKLPGNFDGSIPVENRFYFTNLDQCKFEWQLVNFKHVQDRGAGHQVMKSGTISSPNVQPKEKGSLKIKLPDDFNNYEALYLKAFAPSGRELYCWSWKIDGNEKPVAQLVRKDMTEKELEHRKKMKAEGVEEDNILPIEQQAGDSKVSSHVEVTEKDSLITMKASGISVTFSKKNGTIIRVDNDMGLSLPISNGPVLVTGKSELLDVRQHAGSNFHALEFSFRGDLKNIIWTMYDSGWLQLDYEYHVEGKQYFTGVSFDFPESDIIGARWLGDGPANVWKNRLQGGKLDVWERMYNNVLPGDNDWQYPQFKGYYADVSWMEFNTVYGKFTMVAKEDNLFVRLFHFYGLSGPTNYPISPKGDISFLDNIPPIGTKLAVGISNDTWKLGPEGELNVMDKPVKRTLYFYFGMLN
ncbi:MAG TPA: glycoside hydrolase family 2 TIM barrel-domain containing protein [Sunxiuqinia sp.]|nr:glycoside hydrolase family 2 TIM barrel-domain containing protein [Sunxiuqinia sp.]